MKITSFEEFKELARRGTFVPVCKEIVADLLTPVRKSDLRPGLVYDLVYNPQVTRLLREATASGCQTIGGLDMLVAQAMEQFQWWTGARPSAAVMRAAALKRLSEFISDEDHVV